MTTSGPRNGQGRRRDYAAIFLTEPTSGWGLRGDPYVWRALASRLADVERPAATADAMQVVHEAFCDLVGIALDDPEAPEAVFRAEFDGGGMTGGQVSFTAWRDNLMPLLAQRLRDSDNE